MLHEKCVDEFQQGATQSHHTVSEEEREIEKGGEVSVRKMREREQLFRRH